MRPLCPAPPASSCPANCSTCKRPTAPSTSPIADGIHAGSARPRPRSMAGSKKAPHAGRQHNACRHAAQNALCAGPGLPPQQNTPRCAQCSARRRKQQHPCSQDHPVQNNIPPFARCMCAKVKRCRAVRNALKKAFPCNASAASAPEILSALFLSGAKPYSAGFIQTNDTTLPPS